MPASDDLLNHLADTAPTDPRTGQPARFCVDATCPNCGHPERNFDTGTRLFGCSRCDFTSTTRDGEPTTDPLADTLDDDDDPIGPFDPDNICGATIDRNRTGSQHECTREPHPPHWRHISTCDDRVTLVWYDLDVIDLTDFVLTADGLTCTHCSCTLSDDFTAHYGDCPIEDKPLVRTEPAAATGRHALRAGGVA